MEGYCSTCGYDVERHLAYLDEEDEMEEPCPLCGRQDCLDELHSEWDKKRRGNKDQLPDPRRFKSPYRAVEGNPIATATEFNAMIDALERTVNAALDTLYAALEEGKSED